MRYRGFLPHAMAVALSTGAGARADQIDDYLRAQMARNHIPAIAVAVIHDGKLTKLRSYGVAQRQLLPKVEHRQSQYLNNRAENSHGPTRRRERQMQRFKSPGQAQDFLSVHAFIRGHFHPRRHLLTANSYRAIRTETFSIWQQETCAQHIA